MKKGLNWQIQATACPQHLKKTDFLPKKVIKQSRVNKIWGVHFVLWKQKIMRKDVENKSSTWNTHIKTILKRETEPCSGFGLLTATAKSLQSCLTLCHPIDGSPPGSPVPGILQAKILEWVATSFSNAQKWKMKVKSLSRVRLSDPMDYSLPGSSVHGIFQARVLEWGAIAFSIGLLTACI